jgi:DNA-binding MarR family transcriptional regulator
METRREKLGESKSDRQGKATLPHTLRDWTTPLGDLVTMRLVGLFSLMRRGSGLAQRRQFGLSEVEWRIMTQVGQFAPLSLSGLAEFNLQDRGQMSRAVKSMVARGLLSRKRKPGGPEIEIRLTDQGQALFSRMIELVTERDRRLTNAMSTEDVATLRRLIDMMIEQAEEIMAEELALGS